MQQQQTSAMAFRVLRKNTGGRYDDDNDGFLIPDSDNFPRSRSGSRKSTSIDSPCDRLYYHITVVLLILCVLLLGSKQHFGNPIHCTVEGLPQEFIDSFCWNHGTFIIKELVDRRLADDVAHPGVGYFDKRIHSKIRQGYYKYVSAFLCFIAAAFYMPHIIWKYFERGLMRDLTAVSDTCKGSRDSVECLKWLAIACRHFGKRGGGDRMRSNFYMWAYYGMHAAFYPTLLIGIVR